MSGFFGSDNPRNQAPLGALRVEIRPLMRLVYMWMTLGLLISGVVAVAVSSTPSLTNILYNPGVMFGAIIGELVLVMALSFALRRISPTLAAVLFVGYAFLNGLTLSIIFLIYPLGTISLAFFSAAGTFAAMTVLGYTTELDLSQYRTYFMMALIGLVIAMVVNIFLRSSGLDLIISMAGVLIFTVLTAYDTQKIKQLAADPTINEDGSLVSKLSIMGALTLYLDFVNLFLFLLRLFGRRR
ncbi:MAG: BAX inhibitor (BI)-1/YccA family protein [Anaerolineaceae bacterium]|nr:BAX inhibitor (BI)-1/YccA family protein [Anaerolineaceae bacterium]